MKCSALYKDWIRFLKKNGYFSDYMYTIGRVSNVTYWKTFSSLNRPGVNQAIFMQYRKDWKTIFYPHNIECNSYGLLVQAMKAVDARVRHVSQIYELACDKLKPFKKNVVWRDVAYNFYLEHLVSVYGNDTVNKMLRKIEERKKKREKEAKKKTTNTWTAVWDSPIEVITRQDSTIQTEVRHREREIRGQWFDQVHRNRLRREERWRMRR